MSSDPDDVAARVRALSPLRFQKLVTHLLRREFGASVEDVHDTAGDGNGCDAILQHPDHVHGFQVKTVEEELGDSQRAGVRHSYEVAARRVPVERARPLKKYTVVFSVDLQPGESAWFTGWSDRMYAANGCTIDHRGLAWVEGELLRDGNAGLRRQFAETTADRHEELMDQLRGAGLAGLGPALSVLTEMVKGLATDDSAKRALTSLFERARSHFQKGVVHVEDEAFSLALVPLTEARELLKRHIDDPLYHDVIYWRAVALLGANRWQAALAEFALAEQAYAAVGREVESLWAAGNQGHALQALGRIDEALDAFRRVNPRWEALGDLRNSLIGMLNEAAAHIQAKDYETAGSTLDRMRERTEELGSERCLEFADVMASMMGATGTVLRELGHDEGAVLSLTLGVDLARMFDDGLLLARLLAQLILPLANVGRMDDSRRVADEAISIFERLGDQHQLGKAFNQLGVVYWMRGDHAAAADYLRRDLAICRELNDIDGEDFTKGQLRKYGYET